MCASRSVTQPSFRMFLLQVCIHFRLSLKLKGSHSCTPQPPTIQSQFQNASRILLPRRRKKNMLFRGVWTENTEVHHLVWMDEKQTLPRASKTGIQVHMEREINKMKSSAQLCKFLEQDVGEKHCILVAQPLKPLAFSLSLQHANFKLFSKNLHSRVFQVINAKIIYTTNFCNKNL